MSLTDLGRDLWSLVLAFIAFPQEAQGLYGASRHFRAMIARHYGPRVRQDLLTKLMLPALFPDNCNRIYLPHRIGKDWSRMHFDVCFSLLSDTDTLSLYMFFFCLGNIRKRYTDLNTSRNALVAIHNCRALVSGRVINMSNYGDQRIIEIDKKLEQCRERMRIYEREEEEGFVFNMQYGLLGKHWKRATNMILVSNYPASLEQLEREIDSLQTRRKRLREEMEQAQSELLQ